MSTELKTILKLILPGFLVDNFEIKKVEDASTRIEIYLEENNDLPENLKSGDYISHGFHKKNKRLSN